MSSYSINAISSSLRRIWPLLNPVDPVEAPAPVVPRGPLPAPRIDARLSHLALRTSRSMSMARRNAVLPVVALQGPADQAFARTPEQQQPRHNLGSQVWGQWAERQKSPGAPGGPSMQYPVPASSVTRV